MIVKMVFKSAADEKAEGRDNASALWFIPAGRS
jgi:hypothetical protein